MSCASVRGSASRKQKNSSMLHHPIRGKCFHRTHSIFNRLTHQILFCYLLKGEPEHIVLGGPRDNEHSIQIAEDNIARVDLGFSNLDGHAEIDNAAARALVLRISTHRERWKI